MSTNSLDRRRALSLAGIAWIGSAAVADAQSQAPASGSGETARLPADVTTRHTLELPGRTLHFQATAGAIRLTDEQRAPRADLAFVAFQLDNAEPAHRPVTFAFNGGPGFASAWLSVGAVGPWRIALGHDAGAPSASPEPMPNAETWLDFTDLVFIDPAGTGYSRVLAGTADARRRLWSVDGDIEYLAEAIRRWLDRFDRSVSPKYLLGESYGGFRAPRLTRELAVNQGTGVSGLVLLSPKLDFGGNSSAFDPFDYVTRLPSMAAAARAADGAVTRAGLVDVEHYATTDYLLDLTRGERDAEAIARRSARVAEFTGLNPALVRHHHGLIDNSVFLHELERARGRVGSSYDATVTIADPFPLEPLSEYPDPVLEGLRAPISSAMVALYATRLNWHPDSAYRLLNAQVFRQWHWGNRIWNPPQSMEPMRTALALDPHLAVLIAHGLFDLVTPYLATQLLIDQVPEAGIADRIHLSVYPGGHMFYTGDASRAALRDEAARLFSAG
ncbi:MAG TPA: peptidase S10 [Acetobacteraceae bacterium]|nr:peptidase S10 [Acetobacteraceae bacterium]